MSGSDVAVLVVVLGVPLIIAVINVLKGKYWFAVIGFLAVGLLGLIGAIRLAKPNSRWARGYDEDKLLEAMNRFPKQAAKVDPDWMEKVRNDPARPQIERLDEWPDEDPALWDKITRRAYKKQHGHWPEDAPTGS